MSRLELLLACPGPFAVEATGTATVNAAGTYGIEFHRRLGKKLDPKYSTPANDNALQFDTELLPHVEAGYKKLIEFLQGDNAYGLKVPIEDCLIERAVAYNPVADTARFCEPFDDNHEYPDCRPGEIAGTFDLAWTDGEVLLVHDHKTGFALPDVTSPQLLGLAVALSRIWGRPKKRTVLSILHAPRTGNEPEVFPDHVTEDELMAFRTKLLGAMNLVGQGYLRPGKQCLYCPQAVDCEARGNLMVQALARASGSSAFSARKLKLDLSQPESRGQLHMLLQHYDKIRETLHAANKKAVEQFGPGIRPDGKLVEIVEVARRNLSMQSIRRALGEVAGQQEIDRLDSIGAIDSVTRPELHATRDSG